MQHRSAFRGSLAVAPGEGFRRRFHRRFNLLAVSLASCTADLNLASSMQTYHLRAAAVMYAAH